LPGVTLHHLPLLLLGELLVASTFLTAQLYLDTISLPVQTQLLQLPDLPFASLLVGLDLLSPVKAKANTGDELQVVFVAVAEVPRATEEECVLPPKGCGLNNQFLETTRKA
jgi:hypothetical protein